MLFLTHSTQAVICLSLNKNLTIFAHNVGHFFSWYRTYQYFYKVLYPSLLFSHKGPRKLIHLDFIWTENYSIMYKRPLKRSPPWENTLTGDSGAATSVYFTSNLGCSSKQKFRILGILSNKSVLHSHPQPNAHSLFFSLKCYRERKFPQQLQSQHCEFNRFFQPQLKWHVQLTDV